MAVTMEALGRAYIIRENYIKALPIYNDLILKMTDQELKANLNPYILGASVMKELVSGIKRKMILKKFYQSTLIMLMH